MSEIRWPLKRPFPEQPDSADDDVQTLAFRQSRSTGGRSLHHTKKAWRAAAAVLGGQDTSLTGEVWWSLKRPFSEQPGSADSDGVQQTARHSRSTGGRWAAAVAGCNIEEGPARSGRVKGSVDAAAMTVEYFGKAGNSERGENESDELFKDIEHVQTCSRSFRLKKNGKRAITGDSQVNCALIGQFIRAGHFQGDRKN